MEVKIDGKTFYRYIMPAIESNMYILIEGEGALIVDPNINQEALALLQRRGVHKVIVLLTHEHFDHISGVNWLRTLFETHVICSALCAELLGDSSRNMAKFWEAMIMDKSDEAKREGEKIKDVEYTCRADRIYEDEMLLDWHGHALNMRQAPGHSKGGSLIWLDKKILFSGDNLVNGTGVICRLPGGNKREYAAQTRPVLESLSDEIYILPGHGAPGQLGDMRQYLNLFGKGR
ncbi:MAG: MBL fold metallo-hydrolase [Lachnospiraceae bacterium]|nr:MBL fold metallo-hydrolase [Lachnospiraceae bacterium]